MDAAIDVLVVCTANACRSPMAAALLQHHARNAGLPLRVHSAGTHAGQVPVDPVAVQALAERGLHIGAHQPRQVDRSIITTDGAGLVLTMTRSHLRDVVVASRPAFERTMTLREAVRRLSGPISAAAPDPLGRIAAATTGRTAGELFAPAPADDVADPYGQGIAAVRATADELSRLTEHLVALLVR